MPTRVDLPQSWLDPILHPGMKGYPHASPALRRSEIGMQGWDVLAGNLPLPLAVIKQRELDHNIRWMQRYCAENAIALAPHGKTTMSPQLFQRQLAGGAWGITVATVQQLQVAIAAGALHVLIANEVITSIDLRAIVQLERENPNLQILFLIDSTEQIDLIEAVDEDHPFDVLLEIGYAGGRTGCRTEEAAMALARQARSSSCVRLVGIECYEGLGATGEDGHDRAFAHDLMRVVSDVAVLADRENLFDSTTVILSAGGSGIFDLVVPALRQRLSRPVTGILRSGCYVTHDQGHYKRLVSAVDRRLGCTEGHGLKAAMEVWATVQSIPEPDLAILAVGKRDISFDMGWPLPLATYARGKALRVEAPKGWQVSGMNDQHAYLRGDMRSLAVGDRIVLGLSHPCTTFDKWRWMPIVDDDYRVVDAIVTFF
ncbi:MAG: amino acid deaminase [Proteobacteria bacterium]|nr:amino acid deaminase [Pseudomonadota bacterium]